MTQQSTIQDTGLPALRIAYKNQEIIDRRKKEKVSKRNSKPAKRSKKAKEPLPMFDDYKFKAKKYDPL